MAIAHRHGVVITIDSHDGETVDGHVHGSLVPGIAWSQSAFH